MRGSRTGPWVRREQTSLEGGQGKGENHAWRACRPACRARPSPSPPAPPGLSQVQHPHGGKGNLAACARKRRGCCSAQESLSQSCYPMNEYKPVMSTGLSVLASSTEEGGEIRQQIPNSTCKKDRNKTALLPGAGHTQFPDVSRALWGGGCLRGSQSSLQEPPRVTEENCDKSSPVSPSSLRAPWMPRLIDSGIPPVQHVQAQGCGGHKEHRFLNQTNLSSTSTSPFANCVISGV